MCTLSNSFIWAPAEPSPKSQGRNSRFQTLVNTFSFKCPAEGPEVTGRDKLFHGEKPTAVSWRANGQAYAVLHYIS